MIHNVWLDIPTLCELKEKLKMIYSGNILPIYKWAYNHVDMRSVYKLGKQDSIVLTLFYSTQYFIRYDIANIFGLTGLWLN